jgi:hypothetical protein
MKSPPNVSSVRIRVCSAHDALVWSLTYSTIPRIGALRRWMRRR